MSVLKSKYHKMNAPKTVKFKLVHRCLPNAEEMKKTTGLQKSLFSFRKKREREEETDDGIKGLYFRRSDHKVI